MTSDDKPSASVLTAEIADIHGDIIDAGALRIAADAWNADSPCTCPGVMRTGCPCSRCHGSGWYPEAIDGDEYGYNERYCECADGVKLCERDTPTSKP